jgi:DNA replication protein DnaC
LEDKDIMIMDKKEITVSDLKRANVPEKFWYATLSAVPRNLPYMKKVLAYYIRMEELMDKGIGVYLFSTDNQTGKTSIAVALLKRALRLRKTVFFEEAGRLKNALTRNEEFEDNILLDQRIRFVDLLVIDDLGKEYRTSSGYAESTFENIVRDRIQTMKPIIITGNIPPKSIGNTYSQSMSAILKGSLIPIQISGYNWSIQQEAELKKIL